MQTKDRIFGLDVLRTIAIMTVLVGHVFWVLPNSIDNQTLRLFFFDGVNIFFTLSGYLIGSILLKKIKKEGSTLNGLVAFWRDRWLRTLPAYFFVLALVGIIAFVKGADYLQFARYALFLQNISNGEISEFRESWSLSVEEWFYITTPAMLFVLVRFMPLKMAIPVIIIFVMVLANVIRVVFVQHFHVSGYFDYVWRILLSVACRIDAVMFGVLGAYLSFYKFKIWTNYRLSFFWIGVIGFFVNHYYGVYVNYNNYVLYGMKQVELLFVLMTIPKLSTIKNGSGAVAKTVTFISTISYSLYLTHATLYMEIIRPAMPNDFWAQLPVYWIWAFASAWCLYSTVEKAGLKYRDKLKRKRRHLMTEKAPL